MKEKVEFCERFNLKSLKPNIGDFELEIMRETKNTRHYLFRYVNEDGFEWKALYDNEVEDFTVHIETGLMVFNEISFIKPDGDEFWANLQKRYCNSVEKSLVRPQESFIYAYKQKGLPEWNYNEYLPEEVVGFTRRIEPKKAIKAINGSYIIAEYTLGKEKTGVVICYNVYRDEFFAEIYENGIAKVTHELDAVSISELEEALQLKLESILAELK